MPSHRSLANYGFAVWPADTIEEGIEECRDADPWRLNPSATARSFARDVLNYPAPTVDDVTPARDHVRYLINSRESRGIFLGSVIDLRRYGHCWYVTQGQPREDDLTASIGFVDDHGEQRMLLSSPTGIPDAQVGYGGWDREIPGGRRMVLVDLPPLGPVATGHAIFLAPDEHGISESVGTERLGLLPSPDEESTLRPLSVTDVVDNPKVCRIESSPYRSGKAVIGHLFNWTFGALLERVDGYPTYERRETTKVHRPDRWRVLADDAELDLTVPEIAGRCWKLVSMTPTSGEVIREFRVGPRTVTFDLHWSNADSALIAFGAGYEGRVAPLVRVDKKITFFRQAAPQPEDVPTYALVVLYRDKHIVAAEYALYGP